MSIVQHKTKLLNLQYYKLITFLVNSVYFSSFACVSSHFSSVRLFEALWTVAHQAPTVHGILQTRILEWIAMPSSRVSSRPRNQTCVSYISFIGKQLLYQ